MGSGDRMATIVRLGPAAKLRPDQLTGRTKAFTLRHLIRNLPCRPRQRSAGVRVNRFAPARGYGLVFPRGRSAYARSLEALEHLARWRGAQVDVEAADTFSLLRQLV